MSMIVLTHLTKTYKSKRKYALRDVSLTINEGQVFGLIGPNGAGKSTLIKSIVGLVEPDEGEIVINEDASNRIGYLPEEIILFEYLTGKDYVYLLGKLRGMEDREIKARISSLTELLELPDMDMMISLYSKGNKEKIAFLSTIIHSPKILILDEPFTGLDPIVIQKVKGFITDYAKKGNTILLSTHIIEMIVQICDEITIINEGEIMDLYKINRNNGNDQNYADLMDRYKKNVGEGREKPDES